MRAEKMTEAVAAQTLGEYRVGKSFNPSNNELVDQIKSKAAELIDLIQLTRISGEVSIHDVLAPLAVEKDRLANIAQDQVESAAMFAVKAATKQQ